MKLSLTAVSMLAVACAAPVGGTDAPPAVETAQSAATPGGGSQIADFVCTPTHPFDFAKAASFDGTKSNRDALRAVLDDDTKRLCWPYAALTFAAITPYADAASLSDYIELPKHKAKGSRRLMSYLSAVRGLGAVAGRFSQSASSDPKPTVQYLISCGKSSYWEAAPQFMKDESGNLAGTYEKMASACIAALGLAFDSAGDQYFQGILNDPGAPEYQRTGAEQAQKYRDLVTANWAIASGYLEP